MTKPVAKKSLLQLDVSFGGPSLTQKALFAKNVSVMLRSGLTVVDALTTVQESLTGKFRRVLTDVIAKVESGVPLSQSLAQFPKVFPEVFINVTQAGEASGTLPENLENIAAQLKKDKDLITKVRGAMIYPVIILIATFVLGLAISFFVLPDIVPLFEGLGVELPFTTRMLIAFSSLVEAHGAVVLGVTVAGAIGFVWLIRQRFTRPVTHWLFLHVPLVKKISRGANLARFANTLGTSLKSGISVDEALQITQRSVGNYYYQRALARVAAQVKAGSRLSTELNRSRSLFPVMATRMLMVGEESGTIDETLLYLADFYEEDVDASLKTFTTMLEPLLLLFIGGVVGFLALSIISPIYGITGTIQR